ncbi:type II toxin-antitoxin system RelE/ParE family toxin [Rhodospirillum sp. A1_3_36]|uniref:type II toxin-antitoxin system RelE/ParE family toxin n=1 Tax=Rhodospirillum sp. A1_3_36 TaxID=3391666 RepID=UPI0039A43A3A
MQVIWSRASRGKLSEIRRYIAEHNPSAAASVAARILEAGNALRDFPSRGRPTNHADIRELVITGTPYLLVYHVGEGGKVAILSVWHGAQDRS